MKLANFVILAGLVMALGVMAGVAYADLGRALHHAERAEAALEEARVAADAKARLAPDPVRYQAALDRAHDRAGRVEREIRERADSDAAQWNMAETVAAALGLSTVLAGAGVGIAYRRKKGVSHGAVGPAA